MEPLVTRLSRRLSRPLVMATFAAKVDALLISYPKSGRTWFRFVLSSYFAMALGLPLLPDLHSMFSVMPNFDTDPIRGMLAFAFRRDRPRLPLVAVSHIEYRRRLFLGRPVIFMTRDPRDVLVSSYFHATRHKHRFNGDMGAFIADQKQGLPSLVRYLNGWSVGLGHRRHLVLSYEQLSRDPATQTRRALDFLACGVDEDALDRAIEAGRFSAMQKQELDIGIPGHDYDRSDIESRRMRRGEIGGFAAYLSRRQCRDIEAICGRTLSPGAWSLLACTDFPTPIEAARDAA